MSIVLAKTAPSAKLAMVQGDNSPILQFMDSEWIDDIAT